MKGSDKVYGEYEINDSVLLDIISAPTFQRLNGITQAGVPEKYNSVVTYSRFEHSIGVVILLKKLKATLEEQVAGLLHDISHLAFSHVSEWVLEEDGGTKEDSNEKLTEYFISTSELIDILKDYSIDYRRIIDFSNFNLLKAALPDVSADRIDYSLRDLLHFESNNLGISMLDSISLVRDSITFDNTNIAKTFAEFFLHLQNNYWGSFDSVARYYLFSNILKVGIKEGIICIDDLYKTEDLIMEKIESSNNKVINNNLEVLLNKDISYLKGKLNINKKKKFRYVDPIINNSEYNFCRLSDIDQEYNNLLRESRELNEKGVDL